MAEGLTHLFPAPNTLAELDLRDLGLPSARIIPSTLGERTTLMGALSIVLSVKFTCDVVSDQAVIYT